MTLNFLARFEIMAYIEGQRNSSVLHEAERHSSLEIYMKKWKKVGVILLVLLAVVVIVALLYLQKLSHQGLPDYNAEVVLTDMSGQVTVCRDAYGIPHIYSQNEADLYRATGYVMAMDRIWQMDLFRRVTTGRLSEIFGPDLVETDLLMRALRIPEKSDMVLKQQDAEVLAAAECFADGVNQYLEQNSGDLPLEFTLLGYKPDLWEPKHSLNLIGYMAWDLTMPWQSEVLIFKIAQALGSQDPKLREMIPDLDLHPTFAYPEFDFSGIGRETGQNLLAGSRHLEALGISPFSGSNNWAVAGKKSVSGKPLFANDMHLGLNVPGIWYQMHQVIEGQLNVTGVCLAGAPFVVAGHNDRIAWGMTNTMVDDMDFYLETVNPDDPDLYRFQGEWREMDVRTETIFVKGDEAREKTLRFTHRGPVISEFKGLKEHALSMRWTGNEFSNEVRTVYWLNRAGNWEEFKEAVRTFFSISQNIIYADVDGNIGLHFCAGVPIRKGEGIFVVPGDTDEYDWQGFIPFEELPHVYNPESGYVSSANNRAVGEDYPYYISRWFSLPYRIDRIREMLTAKEKLGVEDFRAMHADVSSHLVPDFLYIILERLEALEGKSEIETEAFGVLESWDGAITRESAAALIFEKMRYHLLKNLVEDELEQELFGEFMNCPNLHDNLLARAFVYQASLWCDDVTTPDIQEDFTFVIQKSFQDTVQDISGELGGDINEWEWGKIHQVSLQHPMGGVKILDLFFKLNRGPFPVGGSFHTVCPFSYNFKLYQSSFGASHRHIYTLEDWDNSWTVIPTGVSGVPSSPFYCNQTQMYLDGKYRPDYITRPKVESSAAYKMIIK
jgi:penicillin amidase